MDEWNTLLRPVDNLENLALSESPLGDSHDVTINSVFKTEAGNIGAMVSCDTMSGNVLWLLSSEYGGQNGLNSLIAATGSSEPTDLTGQTVTYTRVESEKSPVGYAHRWTLTA